MGKMLDGRMSGMTVWTTSHVSPEVTVGRPWEAVKNGELFR